MSSYQVGHPLQDPTIVTFPKGDFKSQSTLLTYAKLPENKIALFFKETSFHPVDPTWPDQPADKGYVSINEKKVEVLDCRIFCVKERELKEMKDVSKKDIGWQQVIGHVIEDSNESIESLVNQTLNLEVDAAYRNQLSLQHSACHLVALALNIAVKSYWKKEPKSKDSLNQYDFDKMAIGSSHINTQCTNDSYRLDSKSLKKEFNVQEMLNNKSQVEDAVNKSLASWIQISNPVSLVTKGDKISDQRLWECDIPGYSKASIPCGGTHVSSLSVFDSIKFSLTQDNKKLLGKTIAVEKK